MKLGILGLPNVGKSTLFNALTAAGAASANYPFCTIDPNVGIVPVPDDRLAPLTQRYAPEKVTPATLTLVDIAGLVRGAAAGEGLGNRFLSHVREVDALLHVVRAFADPDVIHVSGRVDPADDIAVIETELCLADLETLEKRVDRQQKNVKGREAGAAEVLTVLEKARDTVGQGTPLRAANWTPEEAAILRDCFLLTLKPVLYIANVDEADIGKPESAVPALAGLRAAVGPQAAILPLSARIESELREMEEADAAAFLAELGLTEPGLHRVARAGYALLGYISFLTAGPKEVRAWPIPKGFRAPQAAGTIHSDFERGFIRAEIIAFDDLMAHADYAAARAAGLVRSEGKEYVMQDGDVTLFRFNV